MKAVEAVKENFYCFWVLYTQLYTIQLGNLTTYIQAYVPSNFNLDVCLLLEPTFCTTPDIGPVRTDRKKANWVLQVHFSNLLHNSDCDRTWCSTPRLTLNKLPTGVARQVVMGWIFNTQLWTFFGKAECFLWKGSLLDLYPITTASWLHICAVS